MRTRILLASLVFALPALMPAQRASAAAPPHVLESDAVAEKEILKLEQERNQAIISGDAAALERMTADDYTFVTLRGELRTKAEIVKGFQSGSFHYDSREISDLHVRIYGTAAVVTGRSNQKGKENGKDYSGDYLFTRVYAKQGGKWRTVALQTTLIQH